MRLLSLRNLPAAPIHSGTRDYAQKKYLRRLMNSITPQEHKRLVDLHQRSARWYREQKARDPNGTFPKFAHDANHVLPEWKGKGAALNTSYDGEEAVSDIEEHIQKRLAVRNRTQLPHRLKALHLTADPTLRKWPGLAATVFDRPYRAHLGVVQTAHNRQRQRAGLPYIPYVGTYPKWDETRFSYGGLLFR